MNFKPLGTTGINCSVVGLGTAGIASVSGGISQSAADRLIAVARDCGVNLIDTADSYAQGESEKRVGQAIHGERDKFIITTKAGFYFSPLGGGLLVLKPLVKRVLKCFKPGKSLVRSVRSFTTRQDFTPGYIRVRIEASLKRLKTDYLDIFLLHSPPPEALSDPLLFESLRAMQQAGKLRHFGVSATDPAVARRALEIPDLNVMQIPISPARRDFQTVLSRLQAENIGLILNLIFLSGQLLPDRNAGEDPAILRLKHNLETLAASRGASLNRLLIEYALGQPGVTSILTGTNNPEHLKQNVADALAPRLFSAGEIPVLENVGG
jgi:aryl-alcohol dehydrogenase-like predicted oxidoreductase